MEQDECGEGQGDTVAHEPTMPFLLADHELDNGCSDGFDIVVGFVVMAVLNGVDVLEASAGAKGYLCLDLEFARRSLGGVVGEGWDWRSCFEFLRDVICYWMGWWAEEWEDCLGWRAEGYESGRC